MRIQGTSPNYLQYAKTKPTNMVEIAIEKGQPKNLSSQMSDSYVKGMRSFDFLDSKVNAGFEEMRKQTQQKLLNDALLTKAVIIRNSHEATGERVEKAK